MHCRPVRLVFATVLIAGSACAPTIGPVSLPADVLVVLDSASHVLQLINVDNANDTITLPLSGTLEDSPTSLAVQGTTAAVGLGASHHVLLVDLATGASTDISLGSQSLGGAITALAIDNGTVYATSRAANAYWTINILGGSVGGPTIFAGGGGPQGFGIARGNVFVVAGNREHCDNVPLNLYASLCSHDPSFLIPLPVPASGAIDSIPLGPPGNATAAVAAPDGSLYVLSTGNGDADGVLSRVDPITRTFKASYTGFGLLPQYLASDGGDRLYVASASTLSVFSISGQSVIRGPGAAVQGIPVQDAVGLVTDEVGRAYVIQASGSACTSALTGKVRVFGTDLVEQQPIVTGSCPVAAALTEIQANLLPHH
ncbi:MAG TPA: hypothetical protein VHW65_07380 [Gemmatimonadales bacterium]|jgi:hypothetical protein|nr:hypothetical protein [Gemmatimonadales bacterium]